MGLQWGSVQQPVKRGLNGFPIHGVGTPPIAQEMHPDPNLDQAGISSKCHKRNCDSGVPKITIRFDDLLGLKELRKARAQKDRDEER